MAELRGELVSRAVGGAVVSAGELALPDPELDLSEFTGDLDALLLEIAEAQGGVTPDPIPVPAGKISSAVAPERSSGGAG